MSRRSFRRLKSFGCTFLSALGLAALVVIGLPAHRCEAAHTGWPHLSSLVSNQTSIVDLARLRTAPAAAALRPFARRPDRNADRAILAIVLAAVAAFDLWILRHLRRVHLSSRRGRRTLGRDSRHRKRTLPPYIQERPLD